MNILLLTNQPKHYSYFLGTIPLAIPLLGSLLLKNGHQVDYALATRSEVDKKFKHKQYSIVGFSVLTGDENEYLEISSYIKKKYSVYIIWGGIHVTSNPEIINQTTAIDAIILGEGEESFINFVNHFSKTNQPLYHCSNFHIRKNDIVIKNNLDYSSLSDLNILPIPDYKGFFKAFPQFQNTYNFSFITSRGCPYNCSYCHNEWQKKQNPQFNKIRYLSPERVIAEIQEVQKYLPLKFIKFNDDSFAINNDWRSIFIGLYKKQINLPFSCFLHPLTIKQDFIRDLKGAGLHHAYFALECADESLRKKLLNRNYSNQLLLNAFALLKEYKIKTSVLCIFGLPETDLNTDFKTVLFCQQKLKASLARGTILHPYKNTKIYDLYKSKDLLVEDSNSKRSSGSFKRQSLIIKKTNNTYLLENLVDLLPLVVFFKIPPTLVHILIRFPLNKIYNLINRVFLALVYIIIFPGFSFKSLFGAVREIVSTQET